MNCRECFQGRRRSWILLPTVIMFLCSIGATNTAAAQEDLLAQLEALRSTAELALYFTKATVLAPNESDARIYLDAMLQVFAGSSAQQPLSGGLVQGALNLEAALAASSFMPTTNIDYRNAISSVSWYMSMAEAAGQEALRSSDDTALRSAARRAYAFLLAALGSDESGFGLAGIRQMIQWLPNSEVVISSIDSVQDAIDQVLPGGTLYLNPGVYALPSSLKIGKALTLAKTPGTGGEVLFVGPDDDASIYVGNDTSEFAIQVTLRDLVIRGGIDGIVVGLLSAVAWGDHTKLTLTRVVISDCLDSGITIVNSDAVLQDCQIKANGQFGVLIPVKGNIEISGCTINENGTSELAAMPYRQVAGILASERAVLSIRDSTIAANAGSGIHIANAVSLVLERNRITANGGDGLLVWDQASVHLEDNLFLENTNLGIRFADPSCPIDGLAIGLHSFTGSVVGWGNSCPDSGNLEGNRNGSLCPLDTYRYLLEPPL